MSIDEIKQDLLKKKQQRLNPPEELLEHAVPLEAPQKIVTSPEHSTSLAPRDASSSAAPAPSTPPAALSAAISPAPHVVSTLSAAQEPIFAFTTDQYLALTHLDHLTVKNLCDDLDIDLGKNTTKPYALSALCRLFWNLYGPCN